MLSENAIDNLIQPIIDRQESLNIYVIQTICRRVREIGHLLPSDVYKLERLLKMGGDVRKINAEIARITGLQEQDIKNLIKIVALDSYMDAKPFYDYRHKPFIPFNDNIPLQRIVAATAAQTANSYLNLSKSQAFMIRDLTHPTILTPTSIAKTYQSIIDEAIQASQSGVLDYQTAMRRSMEQLVESGIRYVTYEPESGRTYSQRLDTAVRRNILDGIRAINQGVQDETGKQFEADGKEITVHENPAPDHAPIQGHQFTNVEYNKLQDQQPFQDVNGKKFDIIDRAIGTLNCRHFTYSIIIGAMKPNFTQEQLDNILARNEKGYTFSNGKHLTMYECTQYQRKLETQIRKAKDGQIAARTAGDMELAKKYQAKINKYTKKYNAFSKACGLSRKTKKMTVSGYRKISVK